MIKILQQIIIKAFESKEQVGSLNKYIENFRNLEAIKH
jgi:hypothetical protein